MRIASRREKHRRERGDTRITPHHKLPPLFIDRLERLSLQLHDKRPQPSATQLLVSSDRYLAFAFCRMLPVGRPIVFFPSLALAEPRLDDHAMTTLMVDMASLTTSRFAATGTLRDLARRRADLNIYLLTSRHDPPVLQFFRAVGPFHLLERQQALASWHQALSVPPSLTPAVASFSAQEWQILTALAQGISLKDFSRQHRTPYHRIVYRVNRLIQRLQLPDRQSLILLLHRLTLSFHD
ncbi:hypothetical protein [Enterobacter kobei]|uniref:hypothetical protein n=1 Tax=Enterobacter kobei TaxID=208224 RepID=UPI003A96FA15